MSTATSELLAASSDLLNVTAAFVAGLKSFFASGKNLLIKHSLLLITFVYLTVLLALIGPSYRFLTMLTPFTALGIAVFGDYIYKNFLQDRAGVASTFFGAIILFEIFYSVNNQIAYYPVDASPWISSKVRYENYNWGYNELGDFFVKELSGRAPAIRFDAKYKFIEREQDKFLAYAKRRDFELYPTMIVTYGNFDRGAKLWVLDRLHIYRGWPVIDLETYFKYSAENGPDYYDRVGFKNYYFVLSSNIVPSGEFRTLTKNVQSINILNPKNEEAFKIYKIVIK